MIVASFKDCLWKNFGAAIDMLAEEIRICPEELWQRKDQFFYMAYHTSIFLDYYLTQPVKDFKPLLAFTLIDFAELPAGAIDDVIPDSHYSKQQMLEWLTVIREKCQALITNATEAGFEKRWIADDEIAIHGLCPSIVENYSVLQILFYNFRHVQYHVAQLNFILRKEANMAVDWISHAE